MSMSGMSTTIVASSTHHMLAGSVAEASAWKEALLPAILRPQAETRCLAAVFGVCARR